MKQPPQERAAKAARFKLKPANVALVAGANQKVRVKLKGKGALAALVALLRNGATATAKLKVSATDTAGNAATQNVAVRLTP